MTDFAKHFILVAAALFLTISGALAEPPEMTATGKELNLPFDQFQTPDAHGREITFYVGQRDTKNPKPLVVWIAGSGCTSMFYDMGEKGISSGLFGLANREGGEHAVVMAVEKPGVAFGSMQERPGSGMGCTDEYTEQHTMLRWREALRAAIDATTQLPGVDSSRILVMGHSEGADMAAFLPEVEPRITHIAVLAGGGPTQLFDMAELMRQPMGPEDDDVEAREQRVEDAYATWGEIMSDPDSTTKFAWGHPHRRWSSFLAHSPVEHLIKTDARVYLAYGTGDENAPATGPDVARAELVSRGRDVTVDRRIGEDHGFAKPEQSPGDGFIEVFNDVFAWFHADK